MLEFRESHKISNIFTDPKNDLSQANQGYDTGISIDPSKCICANVSTNYSIIYYLEESNIIFLQYFYDNSVCCTLYDGQIEQTDTIKEAFLSTNGRFFSFTTSNKHAYLFDRYPKHNAYLIQLQNITHFVPAFFTQKYTIYIFEMSRNLYLTSKILHDKTDFTNLASIKYSTLLIKNVKWWTIYLPTNHISVITNDSKLHIYKLQDKSLFQEIWTGDLSKFVPAYFQVHENILQDTIFLFLSATTDDLDLFAVKLSSSIQFYKKFTFPNSIQTSQIKALNFDSLILISIPKLWLILFDTIDFSTQIVTNSEALNFETPQLLLNCSSRPDLFFSVESLGFYELQVLPLNMMSLLPQQRLIVAHFIGSHHSLTQNFQETIQQASTKLNPYEFYEFLLEFIISATWHELANKCLEYSQKQENTKNGLKSIAQFYLNYYPHSLHQIHSILHEKVSSNTTKGIRFENIEEEELSRAVESSAEAFHNPTLEKINNDYVPDKFWKRTTILKSLIHLLIQKHRKNELPFCEYPLLVNYNNTHEESKSKINYNRKSIFTFLCDLNEIECKIFNQIEGKSLQSQASFFLFSIHYFLSKRFHFPFFTKNCLLSREQSLEIQSFSRTMQQFLFKLRFFTVDTSYENIPYYQMQLWLNSPLYPYSQKSDNLPSSFVYKWPNVHPSNKRTPKSSDHVFGPFLKYKDDLLKSQIKFPQNILLDREKDYTFEKLLEIYM